MKLDTSVAPEIARLATATVAAAPATVGSLAACLRLLEADPQSWWDLVRFDPARPVRIAVAAPGRDCEAWLLVLPPGHIDGRPQPGHRAADQEGPGQEGPGQEGPGQEGPDEGWDVACLVAGAITEHAVAPPGRPGRPFLPGRIRVRGGQEPRRLVNTGSGYAVSLHARSVSARPQSEGRSG
jgi:hypothetical protein